VSREGALIVNNLFLATACAAVFIGTLYPLALDALTGQRISVGPPFFNLTFGALMVPLLLAMPFGPTLAWKRGVLLGAGQRLLAAVIAASLLAVLAAGLMWGGPALAPLGLLLGFWVVGGALTDLGERGRLFRLPPAHTLRRWAGMPRNAWSTIIAHAGVGMTVIGVVMVTAYSSERILVMTPGESVEIAGYQVRLVGEAVVPGPNYTADEVRFEVGPTGGSGRAAIAEQRVFRASGTPTTEAAIVTFGLTQVYVSIGDRQGEAGRVVRIWHKPFVLLIWLGAVTMALGGLVSLSDRRLRVGVPGRAAAPAAAS
jgi:cytochrome c-type biogenesis protein CcmF